MYEKCISFALALFYFLALSCITSDEDQVTEYLREEKKFFLGCPFDQVFRRNPSSHKWLLFFVIVDSKEVSFVVLMDLSFYLRMIASADVSQRNLRIRDVLEFTIQFRAVIDACFFGTTYAA